MNTESNVAATGTEARVCADIARRQIEGVAKYGVAVESNPLALREWLQHAYEETLDKAIYLRRAIEAMDESPNASKLTDALDLMRDEFRRIQARIVEHEGSEPTGVFLSIFELCERAVCGIEQRVPVIQQRDLAEKRVEELVGLSRIILPAVGRQLNHGHEDSVEVVTAARRLSKILDAVMAR